MAGVRWQEEEPKAMGGGEEGEEEGKGKVGRVRDHPEYLGRG